MTSSAMSIVFLLGGWTGVSIIAVQIVLSLMAVSGLRSLHSYYDSQLSVLRVLADDRFATESSSPPLNALLEDFRKQLMTNPKGANVAALVSKHIGNDQSTVGSAGVPVGRYARPAFVRFVAASLIGLGLFGTFLGFTSSLGEVSMSLAEMSGEHTDIRPPDDVGVEPAVSGASDGSVVGELLDRINRPLYGMKTAFSTSVAGLALTLLISLLQSVKWNYASVRQTLIYELDSFLNSEYLDRLGKTESAQVPAYLQNLQVAAAKIAEGLGERVDSGFDKVGSQLFRITAGLEPLLADLGSLLHEFKLSSAAMAEAAQSFDTWIEITNQAADALRSMMVTTVEESQRLVAAVNAILPSMDRFSTSVESTAGAIGACQTTLEDSGQELLGIMTSSVADFRRMSLATEATLEQFAGSMDRLPGAIMHTASNAVAESLSPAIETLIGQTRKAQDTVEQSWRVLQEYETAVPEMSQRAGREFGEHMSDAVQSALDDVKLEYDTAIAKVVESMKILSASAVKPMVEQVDVLAREVQQLAANNERLIDTLCDIFTITKPIGRRSHELRQS